MVSFEFNINIFSYTTRAAFGEDYNSWLNQDWVQGVYLGMALIQFPSSELDEIWTQNFWCRSVR